MNRGFLTVIAVVVVAGVGAGWMFYSPVKAHPECGALCTPEFWRADPDRAAVVEAIEEGANAAGALPEGITALEIAAWEASDLGAFDEVASQYLAYHGNRFPPSILRDAVVNSGGLSTEIFMSLIDAGADPAETVGPQGELLMFTVVSKGKTPMTILETLVEKEGMSLDVANADGLPLASAAAQFSSEEAFKYLVDKGLDLTSTNPNTGDAPLHFAAEGTQYADRLKLIAELGADVTAVNNQGRTVLHVLADNKRQLRQRGTVEAMLELGADPCVRDVDQKSAIDVWTGKQDDGYAALRAAAGSCG
ncbi:MAG: ankyrin repeat domain-containing protein [Pseudomonadota bacterium]